MGFVQLDPPGPNVITALASVQAEIGGIVKTRGGEGGISYAYRGIDAIASEAQPRLGKAGVVIVPESTITKVVDITVNGKPWTDTFVNIDWAIYGPGGANDVIHATTQGIGRDNSDKGYNKAATQAFKNLLLRLLCIGDPKDDADAPEHQNNATDARPEPPALDDPARLAAVLVYETVRNLDTEQRTRFDTWRNTHPGSLKIPDLRDTPEWCAEVSVFLRELGALA